MEVCYLSWKLFAIDRLQTELRCIQRKGSDYGYQLTLRKSNKQYQLIRIINELVPFVKIISNYIVFSAKTSKLVSADFYSRQPRVTTHYPGEQ